MLSTRESNSIRHFNLLKQFSALANKQTLKAIYYEIIFMINNTILTLYDLP